MLWGSIAAEATAALGHTSKGKSGGVNGRGYPSLAFRRHQRRASHEPLVQHHERGRVHLDVPKGIEFPVGIRTLLNTSRYVTTCTSGLSSLKSTMSRLYSGRQCH